MKSIFKKSRGSDYTFLYVEFCPLWSQRLELESEPHHDQLCNFGQAT